jgi:hypothetical protein
MEVDHDVVGIVHRDRRHRSRNHRAGRVNDQDDSQRRQCDSSFTKN